MSRSHSISTWLAGCVVAVALLSDGCGSAHEPPASEPDAEAPAVEPGPAENPASPVAERSDGEIPEIVARVGEESISRDEYLTRLTELRERLYKRKTGSPPVPHVSNLPELTEEQKAAVLNAMIEARIFGALAESSGVTVSDEEVDAKLNELKRRLVTDSEYQRLLQSRNVSEADVRESIRIRLVMEKYRDSLVENAEFTGGQLEQAYERLKEQGALQQPKTADLLQIFLPVDPDGPDPRGTAAHEDLGKIRERILAGESFEEVAKEVSKDPVSAPRGGLFEKVRRGQLGQSFDDRLFTIPLDEVSEPFRSIKGWHIMKVIARHEPYELSFEEAKASIEKMLLAARRNEEMAKKVAQARPTMDVELFIDLDLRKRDDAEVIPIPADAIMNPDALPKSYLPVEKMAPKESPAPVAPSDAAADEAQETSTQ